MKNQIWVGYAVVVVVLTGIVWLALARPVTAPTKSAESGVITETAQYYTVKAAYPSETPLKKSASTSADSAAVASMKQYELDTIAQFKSDGNFANLTAEDVEMLGFDQGRQEAIDIEYTATSSPHTVSYIFNEYADTLGAHPNQYYKTFTFDSSTGAELSLSELFTSNSTYLKKLSELSRAKLATMLGPDADQAYIASGTVPDDTSFQNFALDATNLVLIFPSYQVGPYVIGTQTLYIPRTELKDILKPEYR